VSDQIREIREKHLFARGQDTAGVRLLFLFSFLNIFLNKNADIWTQRAAAASPIDLSSESDLHDSPCTM